VDKWKIEFNPAGISQLMRDSSMDTLLMDVANQVKAEAETTAQNAQRGPGGTIAGYSEAGFSVEISERGDRPVAIVRSNADGQTAMAAHFYTTKRNGVGHLRAALYKFTHRGA
jgi:hypothetical protein